MRKSDRLFGQHPNWTWIPLTDCCCSRCSGAQVRPRPRKPHCFLHIMSVDCHFCPKRLIISTFVTREKPRHITVQILLSWHWSRVGSTTEVPQQKRVVTVLSCSTLTLFYCCWMFFVRFGFMTLTAYIAYISKMCKKCCILMISSHWQSYSYSCNQRLEDDFQLQHYSWNLGHNGDIAMEMQRHLAWMKILLFAKV